MRCWCGYLYAVRCIWCHCHFVISCFIKVQIGLTFLVPVYPGCPGIEVVKWVSVLNQPRVCVLLPLYKAWQSLLGWDVGSNRTFHWKLANICGNNLVLTNGQLCSAAGKVTAGLAESNGSLPPGGWLTVTCRLTDCTPGSAPGPTFSIEYGKPLPLLFYLGIAFVPNQPYSVLHMCVHLWYSYICAEKGR